MQIAGFAAGPYQTNCYLVVNPDSKEAFAVDPGMGAGEWVREGVAKQDALLTAVVLTHGHIDHVRDAAELGVPVFIHADDAFMLREGIPRASQVLFDAAVLPKPAEVRHLTGGDEVALVGYRFTVQHAPGHSPGCVLLVGDGLVFSGDVLFRGSVGRTDLEYSDPAAMRESLRGPVWDLDDALAVLPGHGPTTTVAHERATNPYLLEANRGR